MILSMHPFPIPPLFFRHFRLKFDLSVTLPSVSIRSTLSRIYPIRLHLTSLSLSLPYQYVRIGQMWSVGVRPLHHTPFYANSLESASSKSAGVWPLYYSTFHADYSDAVSAVSINVQPLCHNPFRADSLDSLSAKSVCWCTTSPAFSLQRRYARLSLGRIRWCTTPSVSIILSRHRSNQPVFD